MNQDLRVMIEDCKSNEQEQLDRNKTMLGVFQSEKDCPEELRSAIETHIQSKEGVITCCEDILNKIVQKKEEEEG